MAKVLIQMPDELQDRVDERAAAMGMTRAAFMRWVMLSYLGDQPETVAPARVATEPVKATPAPKEHASAPTDPGPHRHEWGGLTKPYVCKLCGVTE